MSILLLQSNLSGKQLKCSKIYPKLVKNPETNIFKDKQTVTQQDQNLRKRNRKSKQSKDKNQQQKDNQKSKRKVFSFDNYKILSSTPRLHYDNNFQLNHLHLPTIKSLNSQPKSQLIKFTNSQKCLKLPRIGNEQNYLQPKLSIQNLKTTKTTHLERQKFLEMLQIFESKLIDISDKTKLPKKPKKKLKIKDNVQIKNPIN